MSNTNRSATAALTFAAALAVACTVLGSFARPAAADDPKPDPAAAKAFSQVLESYRARPALRIKSTLKIELLQGEIAGTSEEVKAEFIYARPKKGEPAGVTRIKDFTCYFADGVFTAVHKDTEHSYFREEFEGSPYWSLFGSFQDLPYPHVAILWGEEAEEDVWMQLELTTPMLVPTKVEDVTVKEKKRQRIAFTGIDGTLEMIVDPKTRLIDSIVHEITGGAYVQAGTKKITKYTYEHTIPDGAIPDADLRFDPGNRQRVDMLAALMPPPPVPAPGAPGAPGMPAAPGGGQLVGQPAPPIVLATSENDAVDLEDLQGKVVVIDFWATWCPPCKAALPLLHEVAAWAREEDLPVEVLTVNVWEVRKPADNTPDRRLESVRKFWKENRYSLPVLMDYTDEVAGAYGLTGIPATFIVRSDGVVHARHAGLSQTYVDDLKAEIREALEALEGAGAVSEVPQAERETRAAALARIARIAPIVEDLAARIEGEVRFARHDRMLYATDASIYQVEPLGVVLPRTDADVVATVACCFEHGLALLPRGGGTSLAGQTVNEALVIDFSPFLDGVRAIDVENRLARVEPGLVLDALNRALEPHGLMFGPDVATSTHATLGGMIGNNSAGAHSVLYGRTVENVHGLEVLLADGARLSFSEGASRTDERVADLTRRVAQVVLPLSDQIDRRFPKTRRRVDGYNLDLVLEQLRTSGNGGVDHVNLAHLFCGSEGTLGVTLEATVKLVAAPACKGLAIVAFAGVDEALEAVGGLLETNPAAVELIDDVIIALAEQNIEYRRYVDLLPRTASGERGAVLYVEYFRDAASEIETLLDALAGRFGEAAVNRYRDAADFASAWKLRKAGEPLLHGQAGPRKGVTFIEDTAVAPAHLPEFIRRFREIVTKHGTTASFYAHASVGCLHVRPRIDLLDPGDVRIMEAIVAEVTDLVVEYGGALSGEHGDGRLRSHLLERFYGREICDGFRAIKSIFDPLNLMNPGNITEPASMTERLRVMPAERPVRAPEVSTHFRYEREHGFGGAVDLCNGAGVCRKTVGGTMCPSYRATRDERHATRGRGNALRLAVTGQLSPDGRTPAWNDPETLETLDLCLSCKACKSECPSNVDIARLKAEYLAQGYDRAGRVPLAARAFAGVRKLNRLGSVAPGVATWVVRSRPARAIVNRVLGLDPRRSLPPFSSSLVRWHASRAAKSGAPAVVLLPDCFTVYSESAIGRAATRVLEALGYRVVIPRLGCCGRPHISNGLLAAAVSTCRETAGALMRCVEETGACAVVACEPSCYSAIVDDWLDLDMGLDADALRGLAGQTSLIEDFVEARWAEHPCTPSVTPPDGHDPVLLHGHCHQKALGDTNLTSSLLARVTGAEVRVADTGCCGMAGAFGFTRGHYDLSMRVGELALFPEVRANPDACIAAPGTSCRHQVRDGVGREARHPIEIVAGALGV